MASPKPTKAKDAKVVKSFDNLCSTLKSLSPAFLQQNTEELLKEVVSDDVKHYVAKKATKVYAENDENGTISLPEAWLSLMVWDVYSPFETKKEEL